MSQTQSILGSDFGKKTVRLVLAVVGLLILRVILADLPMLKNAPPLTGLMSPLVLAKAIVDTLIFLLLLGFGIGTGRSIRESYNKLPDLGTIVSLLSVAIVLGLAYNSYQTPVACLVISSSDLSTCAQQSANAANLSNIGNLGNLAGFLQGVAQAEAKMATGPLLKSLQMIAVGCLTQPPDLYGWVFLIAIAVPIVGIVVLISRNLDPLTELLFHKAGAAMALGPSGGTGSWSTSGSVRQSPGGLTAENVDKLAKLKSLLDSGVITREEFEAQKARILGAGVPTPGGEHEGLQKLKALLEAGALTQEEYEIQKRRFLEKL